MNHFDIEHNGWTYTAVPTPNRLEVWESDIYLFSCPLDWEADGIKVALDAYVKGYASGKCAGEIAKAHEIRKALGL